MHQGKKRERTECPQDKIRNEREKLAEILSVTRDYYYKQLHVNKLGNTRGNVLLLKDKEDNTFQAHLSFDQHE